MILPLLPIMLVAVLFSLESQDSMPRGEELPNFVIILCDDLGYADVGCYGATSIATPNIDRMAREGVRFTDFHTTSSVCSPSRASLLTGRYPQRTGVSFVIDPRRPSNERGIAVELPTIGSVLKRRGYATAFVGKWHVGHAPPFLPTARGFDSYFGVPYSNDMPLADNLRFTDDARRPAAHRSNSVPLMRDDRVIECPTDQDTLTQRYTVESIRFIESHRDRPFFLLLSHTMPHVPLAASEDFRGRSRGGAYGDAVEEIDFSTGRILHTLERLNLARNTLVVFTSDNGPWLRQQQNAGSAAPLRDGKGSPYEGGHRVPAIFWRPGYVPAGVSCHALTTTLDLLPTFAAMAKADAPAVDGFDITDLLRGEGDGRSPYDAVFIEGGVRKGPWKLIRRPDGGYELYNLDRDIAEEHDLAATRPDVVRELLAMLPADLARPPSLPMQAPFPAAATQENQAPVLKENAE